MEDDRELRFILVAALLMIGVGGVVDLVLDQPSNWLTFHVLFELSMISLALLLTTALWLGWRRAQREAVHLRATLEERRTERDAWRSSAEKVLQGLGAAIDKQFSEWHLTPAEREVALLLLKGYSHKHIAAATARSERTARQHAAAVYEKAGLGSRAELAAFFLDGLILPAMNHTAVEETAGRVM
jgi:DNA-binding CsgD family transcriptional regulator